MLKNILQAILITISKKYSSKVASKYWKNTTITHGSGVDPSKDMLESSFDFYYEELNKIIKPTSGETLLDYGGGNGEIGFRFKQNGINVSHSDLNPLMVKNAKDKYGLTSCEPN